MADGNLYVGSFDETAAFTCLDAATGEQQWRASFEASLNAPLVADRTGYITLTDTGSILAFDPATGDAEWREDVGQWCPGPVAVADGTVYAVTTRENDTGSLVALDAATGTEQWRYNSNQPLAGSPAVDDGMIFVGDTRGVHAVTTAGDRR